MPETAASAADEQLRVALETVREQQQTIRDLMLEKYEPVAVVGIGLRFPGGSGTPDEFSAFLREGRSGIVPFPEDRFDLERFTARGGESEEEATGRIRAAGGGFLDRIDLFDAGFFNISPKEARYMDPQQRLLLETAWEALEHGNIDPTPLRRSNGGVFVGASSIDYALELDSLDYPDLDGHLASGITFFPLSGRLSYFLGWRGPCVSLDAACASSLTALHAAVEGLRRKECDIALAGAVNALHHPRIPVIFSNANMLAPDAQCKTFDESADGYVRAEGCAVLVLKRYSDAKRDGDTVYGLVRGSAVGQDGDSAGLTVPNGPAQEQVMRAALRRAALRPADVQYVEAHGTGTPLGDPIEMGAIADVFAESHTRENPVTVGSVKTNLGHMEPVAGLVGVIKALLQMRAGTIFPHLNFRTPSGRIPWDRYPVTVPTENRPWEAGVRRALVNSFGFGGTIAAVVLEEPPGAKAAARPAEERPEVFALSAKNRRSLRALVERYQEFLAGRPELGIGELAWTAASGRAHHPLRIAGAVGSRAELDALLAKSLAQLDRRALDVPEPRKTAFLFTGQGSQYPGMARPLYERHPVFREQVDACEELFAPLLGRSVRDLLLGEGEDQEAIHRTRFTQPALFTLEYALAKLWLSWGARPSALIGHSIGEVVAAAVAGVFTLRDAVVLVEARSRLMQSVTAPGGMAAVPAPAAEVAPLLAEYDDLAMAAVNSPTQCVISGGERSLAEVVARLRERGLEAKALRVSHAFHSPLMAEVFDEFRAALAGVVFRAPQLTLISNLTGKVARPAQLTDPEYWVRHIGEPVAFEAGMRAVERRGKHVFVEVGPSTALTSLAKGCVDAGEHRWLSSLHPKEGEGLTVLRSLSQMYAAGQPVDWAGVFRGRELPRVELPRYAFDRRRYWLPNGAGPGSEEAGEPAAFLHRPVWAELAAAAGPAVERRVVVLGAPVPESLPDGVRALSADTGEQALKLVAAEDATDLAWYWRPGTGAPSAARLRAECEANYTALLELLAGLERDGARGVRLWLVTSGAQVLPGDGPGDGSGLAAATLWGFGHVLLNERPMLRVTLVDEDEPGAAAREWGAADGGDFQVAYRGGRRLVRRLRPAEPGVGEPVPGAASPVRGDRAYLVTGGLGALGTATAERLLAEGAGLVALLGRRVPEGAELAALHERLGGPERVRVLRSRLDADTDVAALADAVRGLGLPLGGIVHAAGGLADAPVSAQTWESLDLLFGAKVYGSWLLHELAGEFEEVEFFSAYSSAASVVGGASQSNYAAANAFLDQLLHWRSARGLPALGVNWGPWSEIGMSARLSAQHVKALEREGIVYFTPKRALDAFVALLGRPGPVQLVAGECDWDRFSASKPVVNALYAELVSARASDAPVLDAASVAALPAGERVPALTEFIRHLVARALHLEDPDDVGAHTEFVQVGLDSLVAIDLKNGLEAAFLVPLAPSLAFDHPTAAKLAAHVAQQLAEVPATPASERQAS
ncbi:MULTISPECIES: type I polyketide synthase [Kitasatospora]|uniref:Putative modular polyketide synthase n=1 Tax=Kitasatospora setae (strain ATCC 33774 / DSM 43861 / JCM 3304 / KCC A-0304 / NBRC 14216 / KM-6054) TaxID=452652 RepID=E4NBF2_KITSK|nr:MULTISPECIES: type I polyketide synthase [Kitasatospora]BAJ28533.1 putative modular polyketide synthase [Kitasatospora setae KM-6054]